MPHEQSTTINRIDYTSSFRFAQIFSSMSMALHPSKLILGLVAVTIIFISGKLLGEISGRNVSPNEFAIFAASESVEEFEQWQKTNQESLGDRLSQLMMRHSVMSRTDASKFTDKEQLPKAWAQARTKIVTHFQSRKEEQQKVIAKKDASENEINRAKNNLEILKKHQNSMLSDLNTLMPITIFDASLRNKLTIFSIGVHHAVRLNFGIDQMNPDIVPKAESVIGTLRLLCFTLPNWLWMAHPWFLTFYLIIVLFIFSFFGGAISRISIVEIALDRRITASEALSFSAKRWVSYFLSPITPLIAIGLIGLLVSIIGWFVSLPVLNILIAIVFALAIAAGFIMTLMIVGWIGGVHLMYPALSAQGTDAFDAISRGYGYVISRPWRFTLYTMIAIVFGAISYMLIGLFLFLVLKMTHGAVGAFVGNVGQSDTNLFHAIWPEPAFGQLMYQPQWELLGNTDKFSAMIIMVWVYLTIGVVSAYAISYYYSAYSHVYLILRKYVDGTDPSDIYEEPVQTILDQNVDKVEPVTESSDSA